MQFLEYFETIVKACYNLNALQILCRLSTGLSRQERNFLKASCEANPGGRDLPVLLGHVIHRLEGVGLFHVRQCLVRCRVIKFDILNAYLCLKEEEPADSDHLEGLEVSDLEDSGQEMVLPFLRIAALIVHYYFDRYS